MFSGIVEEIGVIKEIKQTLAWTQLIIQAEKTLQDTKIDDSIAVNGTCLTVIAINETSFTFQVIPETLAKTNLGSLPPDSKVNLERSMTLATRIGGHMVQGHIDAVCQILAIDTDEKGLIVTFSLPNELKMLVVNKGYVTLDGMSLTVINRQDDQFSVAFIPHTLQATIVQFYQLGQAINIEVDVMGKYIHQYLVNYLGEYYAKH